MIDWSIFDKQYPVEDGIINTLSSELHYDTPINENAKSFFDVHNELKETHQTKDLLQNKNNMARLQKDFYDKMASGFQAMDDRDKGSGGVFWWKITRLLEYDEQFFKRKKLLFIGAGNCRLAMIYAKMGYEVVATDISKNMLAIGKKLAEEQGIEMIYVVQNAEQKFPFKSEYFDTVYSLCVVNHIVDWENYFQEKLRCVKPDGILLERMPNASLWSFWKNQKDLNDGIEIKAKHCHPDSAKALLEKINVDGKIWTHDRLIKIDLFLGMAPRKLRLGPSHLLYRMRSYLEDRKFKPGNIPQNSDRKGIYTMIYIDKKNTSKMK